MPYLIDAHHIGSRQTGNETWIRNICRELVALAAPGELVFAAAPDGTAEVRELSGGRDPVSVETNPLRRLAWELPRLCRRIDADALLVQYTLPLSRVRGVVMVHDLSAFDPGSSRWLPWRFRTRVRASVRDAVRRSAFLLAPSEFTRHQLIELYHAEPDRVVITPNAVDPALRDLIDDIPHERKAVDTRTVLVVGNVLPRKNLATLASAVRLLREAGHPVQLRVVGSVPPQGRDIIADLERSLGDALSVTGYVRQDQLAREYCSANLLAFPSLFEGFGIPVLEAMYAGLPVIVSDRGSLAEVGGAAATVVEALNVDAWAAALQHQLFHTSATTPDERRQHALSYSWSDAAREVLAALRTARTR